MSEPVILPGAAPISFSGGPTGVLVIHGFTGSPQSMLPITEACIAAGHTVEMPRLPGHGTTVEDMLTTDWDDWSKHVEHAYLDLQARCDKVFVTGLSMGGALTLWLAARHDDVAGIAVVNSAGMPDPEQTAGIAAIVESGQETMDAIGGDIAKEGVEEVAYDKTPLPPLLSLFHAIEELDLGAISCPTLIMVSDQDHVVPPETADYIAEHVATEATVVHLENSFHVATLDHDADLINRQILDFIAAHS